MRRKSKKSTEFIQSLHNHLKNHLLLRKKVQNKTEHQMQTEIRHILFEYMKEYFKKEGWNNPEKGAQKYFYWEGQEGRFDRVRNKTFASRNYPDFIITRPYKIAIEYKKSSSGSIVKQGIGQCIMHTLGGEFDFVYCLIHDENNDKKIVNSIRNKNEKKILGMIRESYNVYMNFL